MNPFLTAQWRNLLNLSYAVDPGLLEKHVPPGLELDVQEGKAFVSLVAFTFHDTRVKGIMLPGYKFFPELNLRYYLKHKGVRGVAFIKELVPKRAIATIARAIYNEPYERCKMLCEEIEQGEAVEIQHRFKYKGAWQQIEAKGSGGTYVPEPDSQTYYFKEHQWGFGRKRNGKVLYYEVRHPEWAVYHQLELKLDMDVAHVYGKEWEVLQGAEPICSCLAVGSDIAVYPAQAISLFGR